MDEKKAAAERQINFARQLDADVETLEGKLGGLERQVSLVRQVSTQFMFDLFGGDFGPKRIRPSFTPPVKRFSCLNTTNSLCSSGALRVQK